MGEENLLNLNELLDGCNKILPEEAGLLVDLVVRTGAKTILEIGGGYECSASGVVLAYAVTETGGHVYTIDPRHSPKWDEFVDRFGVGEHITKIVGESPWCHSDPLLKDIKDIDILFIDGDHNQLAIITDFHYWSRFVKPEGLIIFHDYNESETGKEVKRAIRFIRDSVDLVEVARVNVEIIKGTLVLRRCKW